MPFKLSYEFECKCLLLGINTSTLPSRFVVLSSSSLPSELCQPIVANLFLGWRGNIVVISKQNLYLFADQASGKLDVDWAFLKPSLLRGNFLLRLNHSSPSWTHAGGAEFFLFVFNWHQNLLRFWLFGGWCTNLASTFYFFSFINLVSFLTFKLDKLRKIIFRKLALNQFPPY